MHYELYTTRGRLRATRLPPIAFDCKSLLPRFYSSLLSNFVLKSWGRRAHEPPGQPDEVGRQVGVADIVLTHGSISREQAVLTVSASGTVVVTDAGSAQGTYISGKRLEANKKYALPPGRSLVFGKSTRVYKLREGSTGLAVCVALLLPSRLSAALRPLCKWAEAALPARWDFSRTAASTMGRVFVPSTYSSAIPWFSTAAMQISGFCRSSW